VDINGILDVALNLSGLYSFYAKRLEKEVVKGDVPNHIAIVLDGNRRWAKRNLIMQKQGHFKGADAVENLLDWWQIPEKIRKETRHTLGALNALLNYVHGGTRSDPRFTDKVVLAGGSVGAAFPVILTSFVPEKVAGLMVVYGFTNFQHVIQPLLFSQGLLHFDLTENSANFSTIIKISGVRLLSHILSFVLGNILKYGEMESYLPDIYQTPIHFINGTNDPLVPPEAYLPMWESAPEPKSEKLVEGGHFNPRDPKDMLNIGKLMYEWAVAQGIRSCFSQIQ